MNLNPHEVYAYICGLKLAKNIAQRYKGIDMTNYIGELDEAIDRSENIPGYQEFNKKLNKEINSEIS